MAKYSVKSSVLQIKFFLFLLTASVLFFQNCAAPFDGTPSKEILALSSVAPELIIISKPPSITNENDITFLFSALANPLSVIKGVYYSLDGVTYELTTTPDSLDLLDLADANYNLKFKVVDNRGQLKETEYSFAVDTTQPTVVINQSPATPTSATTASFIFAASDNFIGVEKTQCALDAAAFTDCVSPVNLINLAMGAHTFKVRTLDKANNESEVKTAAWTVDLEAPVLTINAGPAAATNLTSATFEFSAIDSTATAIVSFQCSLDAQAFAACVSPITHSGLADGNHTFKVRAIDDAGNSSEVTRLWLVDTVAPVLISSLANFAFTSTDTQAFNVTVSDALSGLKGTECRLDNDAFTACAANLNLMNIAVGIHNFQIKAIDNANNETIVDNIWERNIDPPQFKVQPADVVAIEGQNADIEVKLMRSASFGIFFDLFRQDNNGNFSIVIFADMTFEPPGSETTHTLSLKNVSLTSTGRYMVRARNAYGSVDSQLIQITVTPKSEKELDPAVDNQ